METEAVQQKSSPGLSATGVKWVALFFMTLDHLAAFGYAIPLLGEHYTLLRTLGRIAAPLFLFAVAESMRHTRSKPGLILRYYLTGVAVGLFTAVTNLLMGGRYFTFYPGNILFTFFYTALYIWIIEGLISGIRDRTPRRALLSLLALAGSLLAHLLVTALSEIDLSGLGRAGGVLVGDLIDAFVPSPYLIDYSPMFILMGVGFYFAKTRLRQAGVFLLFCGICWLGVRYGYHLSLVRQFGGFFNSTQRWMVLALPVILLYTGRRGRGQKWFFYLYYPVHRYLIALAAFFWPV